MSEMKRLEEENARLRQAGEHMCLALEQAQSCYPPDATHGGILVTPATLPPTLIVNMRLALVHWEASK